MIFSVDMERSVMKSFFVSTAVKSNACRSLKEAISSAKACGQTAEIILDEGCYELDEPLKIDFDGLTIRGTNRRTTVSAGKKVWNFKQASDPGALVRLETGVLDKVLCADLSESSIADFASIGLGPFASFWGNYPTDERPDDGPGLEVFSGNRVMKVARYPNDGFIIIEKATGSTLIPSDIEWVNNRNRVEGAFIPADKRPLRWIGEEGAVLFGYWAYDWAMQRHKIASIDSGTCEITVEQPYHNFGYTDGMRFFGQNLLCELDEPGEWYLDRKNKLLYIYPYEDGVENIFVSVHKHCLSARQIRGLTIEGIQFEQSRDAALMFENCSEISIRDCTVRNTGGWAVIMEQCSDSSVDGCEIYGNGAGGVLARGGDRVSLTPSGLYVTNCRIHHIARWYRMYTPAVLACGVGVHIEGNIISEVPHIAIGFHGNDHIIEKNEIFHSAFESNDAGVIYAGRDWSCYGNVIRYNYLHDCSGFEGKGCQGIYLDDSFSSVHIYSNLFERMHNAVFLGGGRDIVVENNTFAYCKCCVHIDNRLENWAAFSMETTMLPRLSEVPYQSAVWREQYPSLAGILENHPEKPLGTAVRDNTCFHSVLTDASAEVLESVEVQNNRDIFPEYIP